MIAFHENPIYSSDFNQLNLNTWAKIDVFEDENRKNKEIHRQIVETKVSKIC